MRPTRSNAVQPIEPRPFELDPESSPEPPGDPDDFAPYLKQLEAGLANPDAIAAAMSPKDENRREHAEILSKGLIHMATDMTTKFSHMKRNGDTKIIHAAIVFAKFMVPIIQFVLNIVMTVLIMVTEVCASAIARPIGYSLKAAIPAMLAGLAAAFPLTLLSSIKYKKDVSRVTSAGQADILDRINKMHVITFRYLSEDVEKQGVHIGLTVEQFQQMFPELYKTVDRLNLGDVMGILMAAQQASTRERGALRAQVERLTAACKRHGIIAE